MSDIHELYRNFFTKHFQKPQEFVDNVRKFVRFQSRQFKGVLFAGILNESSEVLLPLIELDPSVSDMFRHNEHILRHILDVLNLACTQEYTIGTDALHNAQPQTPWLMDILRDEDRHEVIFNPTEPHDQPGEQTFFTQTVKVDDRHARVNVPKAFFSVRQIQLQRHMPVRLNCRLSKFAASDNDFNLFLLIVAQKRDNVEFDFNDLETRMLTVTYRAVQELRTALAESQSYTGAFLQIHALEQIIDYYLRCKDDEARRLPDSVYGKLMVRAHPAVVKKVVRLRASHHPELKKLLSSVDRTSATPKETQLLDEINDYIVRHRPRPKSVSPSRWRCLHEVPTFCVTSALGGVGKTSIAYALAHVLSQNAKKVCLVETDVTNPSLFYLDEGFSGWVGERLPLDEAFDLWREERLAPVLGERNRLLYETRKDLHLLGNSASIIGDRPLRLARNFTSGLLTSFLTGLVRSLGEIGFDAVVIDTGGGIRDYAKAVLSMRPDVTFLVSHPNRDSILGALISTAPYLPEEGPTVLLVNESFPWDEDLLQDTEALIDYCRLDTHSDKTIRKLLDSPFFLTSLVPWNPAWKRRVGMLDHTNNLEKVAKLTLEFIDAPRA